LHTEDLCNHNSYQNYPSDRKKGMRFASYMADMGMTEVGALLWWGSLKEGGHGEHIGVDGIQRLKLILRNTVGACRMDSFRSGWDK
jgi:hypothetical protein